jgi:hypothetical protein
MESTYEIDAVYRLVGRLMLGLSLFWHSEDRATQSGKEGVTLVLGSMAGSVCLVESCPLVLAHIALWHTRFCSYRGYALYADANGKTYFIDPSCQYLTDTASRLVCVEGTVQAKALVDALLAFDHT